MRPSEGPPASRVRERRMHGSKRGSCDGSRGSAAKGPTGPINVPPDHLPPQRRRVRRPLPPSRRGLLGPREAPRRGQGRPLLRPRRPDRPEPPAGPRALDRGREGSVVRPPGRRIRPAGSRSSSSSRNAFVIVILDRPRARLRPVTPACPTGRASLAANSRRAPSSGCGQIAIAFHRRPSTSATRQRGTRPPAKRRGYPFETPEGLPSARIRQ